MKLLFSLLPVFVSISLFGQEVIHPEGTSPEAYLPDSIKYVSPAFETGFIRFKDGNTASSEVNIYLRDQSLRFISPEKDTLLVSNNSEIFSVTLGNRYYRREARLFLEVLSSSEEVSLCLNKSLSFGEPKSPDFYGFASRTISTSGNKRIIDGNNRTLSIRPDVSTSYKRKDCPYLLAGTKLYKSSLKAFQKCFKGKEALLYEYLERNTVDFDSIDDVSGLFNWMSSK